MSDFKFTPTDFLTGGKPNLEILSESQRNFAANWANAKLEQWFKQDELEHLREFSDRDCEVCSHLNAFHTEVEDDDGNEYNHCIVDGCNCWGDI